MLPRATALPLLLLAACGTDTGTTGKVTTPPETQLRAIDARTAGADGDALAAGLLRATNFATLPPGHSSIPPGTGTLEAEQAFRALAHLEASGLASGSGAGLAASARILRLAAEPGAPPDLDQSGDNLGETLAAELQALADLAGAVPSANPAALLFGWSDGTAERAAASRAERADYATMRTAPGAAGRVSMREIGAMLHARAVAASGLLRAGRGSRPGSDPDSGRLGLQLLQQAVAIDETLLEQMFMRADTRALARLADPANYDPEAGLRWLPGSLEAQRDATGVVRAWAPGDGGSDLEALAQVLRGATLLAWLGSAANPHPDLRDTLNGHPFGPAPRSRRGIRTAPQLITGLQGQAALTYEDHVKPILDARCVTCHGTQFPGGGITLATYEGILKGGNSQAQFPAVVKGDRAASLLYRVLNGDTQTARRMPLGGPYLAAEQIDTIGQWIDDGLLRAPPRAPDPGIDLVTVLLRNLRAMHVDPKTGLLHERHEGDAGSQWASSRASGTALLALTELDLALPQLPDVRTLLTQVAGAASTWLVEFDGTVHGGVRIDLGFREGEADLASQAAMAAGMLAAGRRLQDARLRALGRGAAKKLVTRFWNAASDLFRNRDGGQESTYDPAVLALVFDALREAAFEQDVPEAAALHDRFFVRLRPVLVFSEWSGRGEVLHDGRPDTDGNGVPEPEAAGDAHGRAPLFAGEIRAGLPDPVPDGPVTWSRHVLPLFRATCAQCHMYGNLRGNYSLDTPERARIAGDSGGHWPLIVPGKPEESLLWRKLVERRPPVGDQMPLMEPPLDARGKALVEQWIRGGALAR